MKKKQIDSIRSNTYDSKGWRDIRVSIIRKHTKLRPSPADQPSLHQRIAVSQSECNKPTERMSSNIKREPLTKGTSI
ncbi:unnamed protein product, partial [Nesidiocoris tenuis]